MLKTNQLAGFGSRAARDPHFDKVKLLLPCIGSDGSTTFTDYSRSARAVTANGNAQINAGAGLLDGADDFLSITDSADWDFGPGDFAVEGDFKFTTHTTVMTLVGNYLNGTTGWSFQRRSDTNTLRFGNGDTALLDAAWTPTDGVWYRLKASRKGTSLSLYVDEVAIGSTTNSTDISGSTSPLLVGALFFGGSYIQDFNGRFKHIRISVGQARPPVNYIAEFPRF